MLVLAGLFAAHEPPATISLRGAPPQIGAELEVLAWMAPEEEAMAPFGAPLGLLAFAGWLLDRSPFTGTARADEMPEAAADGTLEAAVADAPLLARLSMQIEIAHAALVVEEAARWHARVEAIARESELLPHDELRLAEATVAHAEIEEARARLALELVVDRHEDGWGVRLEGASWPRWADSPPRAVEALYAALDEERHAEARGHWRRMNTAADLAPTHELHVAGLDKVAEAWREQFDHVQRSVAELLFVERLSFDARVMELDTLRQRALAEAHLLALLGRLSEADLQHPTTE